MRNGVCIVWVFVFLWVSPGFLGCTTKDGSFSSVSSNTFPWPDTANGVHGWTGLLGVEDKNSDIMTSYDDSDIAFVVGRFDTAIGPFICGDVNRFSGLKGPRLHYSWYKSVNGPSFSWPPGDQASGWAEVNRSEAAFLHSTDPAGIVLEPGTDSMTIAWKKDGRNGIFTIDGYQVELASSREGPFTVAATTDAFTTRHTFSLPMGSTTFIRVQTLTGGEVLGYSEVVEGSTNAPSVPFMTDPQVTLDKPAAPGDRSP